MTEMTEKLEKTLTNLKSRDFDAHLAKTVSEANKIVLSLVPVWARIGVGDSATLRQMGILHKLHERGNKIYNLHDVAVNKDICNNRTAYLEFMRTQRKALVSDVFMASASAVTEDGMIMNIDHGGNRVAGTIFGCPLVVLCVGRNKIVKDEEEADWRIRNVIVEAHVGHYREGRDPKELPPPTPCLTVGRCMDCRKGCCVKVTLRRKTQNTDLAIVLIDEDLGLGWNPEWPQDRKDTIYQNYCMSSPQIKFPKRRAWHRLLVLREKQRNSQISK